MVEKNRVNGYTKNQSVLLLIDLMLKHGIKKVVVSPGNTNLELVAGLQYNGGFELYSCIDERSASYMACGLATASGECIAITCTESTASRDYYPGITEAYYRKLPILTITGVHDYNQIGNLQPQIIDRSRSPKDTFKTKVHLPIIKDEADYRNTELLINKAILELKHRGNGPVHIDLPCSQNNIYDFSVPELPDARVVERITLEDKLPLIPKGRIVLFIGSHLKFSDNLTALVDEFCSKHDAVVLCDHTSGYSGKYAVHAGIISAQSEKYDVFNKISLLIHLGESSGDDLTVNKLKHVQQVWRVSQDGEIRDTFGKLSHVFEMSLKAFFSLYNEMSENKTLDTYLMLFKKDIERVRKKFEKMDIPFSNLYVASVLTQKIADGDYVYLGVSNTIRSWNLFEFKNAVITDSNVGCRGIDGVMSSALGASLIHKNSIQYCVLGDLSFFYDLNLLGNREIKENLRIIVINNNGGGVFKLSVAPGHKFLGDSFTDTFIAAANHFNHSSSALIKAYVENLGFRYLQAKNKEEFENVIDLFLDRNVSVPMLLEVDVTDENDRIAFEKVYKIEEYSQGKVKGVAKKILGENGAAYVKQKILERKG